MISIHNVDILYSLKHPLHNMEMVKKLGHAHARLLNNH